MTPLRNVHKLWVACGQQREHLQSEIFKLQMFEANIYQLSQLFAALHHCTHLVISVLQKENWPDGHVGMCPAFCASPRTHQRVIGPSSIAWWVIHLRNLNTLTLCVIVYAFTYIQHSMILLSVSVDSWLDAQVRADRGRVVLCKGEQRLDLRALQRPLLGSRNPFTSSPFREDSRTCPSSIIISFLCSPELCYY